MLPSKHKLNSVQFKTTFDTGKQLHTDHLFVKYLHNQDDFRAAAVVSKKHSKTAILRNYKRRQIFNALKNIHHNDPSLLQGVWMTVMLKKDALQMSATSIQKELQQGIAKI